MKTLFSILALASALTSAAWAEPGIATATAPAARPESAPIATAAPTGAVLLTQTQLDAVTAGGSKPGLGVGTGGSGGIKVFGSKPGVGAGSGGSSGGIEK